MGFQDVEFQPSRASFSTMFLKICGRGESLVTITCLNTVVVGWQGHALCKMFLLQQSLLLCQLNFMEIIRLLQR